ncbi:SLC13 family permease [Asanoa sp. NPDC049518]|uniref:SLC13 family permease n=1 Tax=unclassified Asanoa TaxID=2685164 RepID=UPI0034408905
MNGYAPVAAIVIFSIAFVLIATERIHRVAVVLGAAGLMAALGLLPGDDVGTRAGLTFNDFIVHMSPIVVVLFVLFVVMARFMFRKSFVHNPDRAEAVMRLNGNAAIKDKALLARCLAVLLLVTVGFALHSVLHLEPAIIALLGAGLMVLVSGVSAADYLAEVEWTTLVFFMGLFVMVGGLVETGVIHALGGWAVDAIGDDYFVAATALVFGSAILGAFFDNIPYVATMAPVVEDLVARAPDPQTGESLW